MNSCLSCLYWDAIADDPWTYGWCRKNPPVVIGDSDEARFPKTHEDEWCGSWRDGS